MSEGKLRVAFETLGCRSNYADTVDLQAALMEHGAVPCDFRSDADVYVINTCTVTDSADKEAMKLIRRARRKGPEVKVVVTGCLARINKEELLKLSEVDAVVFPDELPSFLRAVLGEMAGREEANNFCRRTLSDRISGPGSLMGEVKARARYHLRIQDGCDSYCTYCIIPQVRGRPRSREMAAVLEDISKLAATGYREVVLTGTHIGAWGREFGSSLLNLLMNIVDLGESTRIRLSSLDPNELTPELLDFVSQNHVFCQHLHICVQAFSDYTLKRMNRRYRMADVREILCYTNRILPGCCIGADVIAGFPGESRQEVDKGIEEFLRLPISYLHVFPYSERTGTAAERLDGRVDPQERRRRASMWRAEGSRRRVEFLSGLIGRRLEVIVERYDEEYVYGTSHEYAAVKIPLGVGGIVCSEAVNLIGTNVPVMATKYDAMDGKLLCQS